MIERILDISKIESGQMFLKIEEINIFDIIRQTNSSLRSLYNGKNLKFETKGLKSKSLIFADRIKLKQIIYNLLSNAIKFTETGSINFEFRDNKNAWEFNIKDTGIGIAEKDYNLIFKDFKRVRSPYVDSIPGTGLGLALTKRLVNLHGGSITFTSILGKGTTFTFTIPKEFTNKKIPISIEQFVKNKW
jgi:signal transduction histidine kinase